MPEVDLNKVKDELKSYGFKESVYPVYLLNNDNNTCLRADIPEKYESFPNLPMTPDDCYFKPATFDVIAMYFKGLTMDLAINTINNWHPKTKESFFGSANTCDYCGTQIIRKNLYSHPGCAVLKDSSYYYCQDCYKHMCPLCHAETNIHIAFKNKTNLRKFEKRLPHVLNCINKHNMIYIPYLSSMCSCDICGNSIKVFTLANSESNELKLHSFGKGKCEWYFDRDKDMDVCRSCALTEEGKEYINENDITLKPYYPVCHYSDIGSILDWIPIYVSQTSDFILYNMNPNSPKYKRMIYCYNDYGFHFYYMNDRYKVDCEMEIEKMNARILQCFDYERTMKIFNVKTQKNEYNSLFSVDTIF